MPLPVSRLALLTLGLLGVSLAVAATNRERDAQPALQTIASLDVPRYLGAWYEIAKFPNRFQKQCERDTTAHYSKQPDGSLQVINRCRRADGSLDEVVGSARQVGAADSPKLEVRFAPGWLSFLPMVWGDYWVVDLDPDYQLAAVSEPKREYLWILSRTPNVPRPAMASLLDRLKRQGFDVDKLQMTRQAD